MATATTAFDLDEFKRQFPEGWGPSARETKSTFLMDEVNRLMGAGGQEAHRLNTEEEARGQRMEDTVKKALPDANAPTMTDESIRTALTDKSDEAARRTNQSMAMLRSQLGSAGVIGGGRAAGMAGGIELQRQGQIIDATRALYLEKTKQDALDRARNFQNQLIYANAQNRPVSMIDMDWLQNILELRLGQQGTEAQRSAAKDAAKASENAGKWSLAGNVAGAFANAAFGA